MQIIDHQIIRCIFTCFYEDFSILSWKLQTFSTMHKIPNLQEYARTSLLEYAVLLDETAAFIITISGNLRRAENAIRDTDTEREYNRHSLCWSTDDAVDILQRLQLLRADIDNEIDYLGRQGCQ